METGKSSFDARTPSPDQTKKIGITSLTTQDIKTMATDDNNLASPKSVISATTMSDMTH